MKWVAFVIVSGCAVAPWQRALPASLVPALQLRAAYRLRHTLGAQHQDLGVGAWLRWTPRAAASSVASQLEQVPAVWLAPCALEDLTCLRELAEAEHEIAAALRERP